MSSWRVGSVKRISSDRRRSSILPAGDADDRAVAAAHGPAGSALGRAAAAGRCRRPADGGAVASLHGDLLLFAVGITPVPEAVAPVRAAVESAHAAVAPWATGGSSLDFAETPRSGAALFGPAVRGRLREVKAAYDPTGLIRADHRVEPADR